MKIAFLGMRGRFSRIPFQTLITAGSDVCMVLVPAIDPAPAAPLVPLQPQRAPTHDALALPLLTPYLNENIVHLAWAHQLPIYAVRRMADPAVYALFQEVKPDVACVACFNQRIPTDLLDIPPHGFLNLHPSLLPAYRGPTPLFWQFRHGEEKTGVTVHWMDEGLDTGDIAAQEEVPLPDGILGPEAEATCARAGGTLLVEVLQRLQAGTQSRRAQSPGGSYQPAPGPEDFRLDTAWSARRAFNFMRGSIDWGRPYVLTINGKRLLLSEALAYTQHVRLDGPLQREGETVRIQFADGILRARLA